MKKVDVKKLGLAGGIAAALVVLVVAFVTWQQPAPEPPELSAPSMPAVPVAAAQISDVTPVKAPVETLPSVPKKEVEPPKPKTVKTVEKKKAPPKKVRRVRRPLPKKRQRPPVRRAPDPEVIPVAPVAQRGAGFKVKFKNLAVLERLVHADHVALVLEYADGTRFLLPRELDGELVALHVPATKFQRWVEQKRVSELEPTPALMKRFEIHRGDVRYLAVLSADLRDIIAREADRARVNVDRSVMVIDAARDRPMVSVLLPRK